MLASSALLGLALAVTSVNGSPLLVRRDNSTTSSTTLDDICDVDVIEDALPANDTILGIQFIPDSVTAEAVNNATVGQSSDGTTYNYCNVTVSYTHTGSGDEVVLEFALPEPSDFENRFYVSGGGGYALSSDATGGLEYGAAGGASDAGYDSLSGTSFDEVALLGNGTNNWEATYMFSYQALGEMVKVGKALTKSLYETDTLYTYYEGCSDGGREGHSQLQRYPEEYDGVITGAPAFRYSQQQINHMFSTIVAQTLDYTPPPCEMEKIVNLTIEACDGLDGREDGVISRTDLCMLNFDLNSTIGESYYCAAEESTSLGLGFSKRDDGSTTTYTPDQNGTVTAEGVAVVQAIYDGLFNSQGERAYVSYQIGSEIDDISSTYNNDTESYDLEIASTGGEYVAKFVQLLDIDNLESIENVTYDTLIEWMEISMKRYYDSLQTIWPDMSEFANHGGKLIHYHGESDPSIPTASSVHYWQSVKDVMYPNMTLEEALTELDEWYQFYLVPGAAHCGTNSLQPGPYPENNMEIMIDWVENGIKPSGLNATVQSGDYEGEEQLLCKFPLRPIWSGNSSEFSCVFDEDSYDTWTYDFPAFKTKVY